MGWFGNLMSLFRPDPTSKELLERLYSMIATANRMFDAVTLPLFDESRPHPEREFVYGLDKELNIAEVEIRRRLLTSIAVNPIHEIATRMLLLSGSKHVERCGDLTKNVFEVFERSGPLVKGPYQEFLLEQRDFIAGLFDRIRHVFDSGDIDEAERIMVEARQFSQRDGEIVHELIQCADCPQPVAIAMLTRLLKRIMGHLVNMARETIEPAKA